jgi:uncharacterized membrane protein YhaH (DUF805 family)
MKYYLSVLKKYAVFKGRASRKEYWMFILFYFIFSVAAQILDAIFKTNRLISYNLISYNLPIYVLRIGNSQGLLTLLYSLILLIPSVAVTVRRLHDIGKSGWWALVFALMSSIPIILASILIGSIEYKGGTISRGINLLITLAMLISLASVVWFIVWLALPGDPNENAYGPVPEENV